MAKGFGNNICCVTARCSLGVRSLLARCSLFRGRKQTPSELAANLRRTRDEPALLTAPDDYLFIILLVAQDGQAGNQSPEGTRLIEAAKVRINSDMAMGCPDLCGIKGLDYLEYHGIKSKSAIQGTLIGRFALLFIFWTIWPLVRRRACAGMEGLSFQPPHLSGKPRQSRNLRIGSSRADRPSSPHHRP